MTLTPGTRILTRSQTAAVADLNATVDDLRVGFVRTVDDGLERIRVPLAVDDGSFHLVAGGVRTKHGPRFVTKVNGWFADGVTGSVVLCDATDGAILAVMDAAVLTRVRTAALSGVVASALRRTGAERIGLLGAGRQSELQAPAIRYATGMDEVVVYDPIVELRDGLVARLRDSGFIAVGAPTAEECAAQADVLVSVVPSTEPVVAPESITPGTLVIALGADAPGKREHGGQLLGRATIVTDVTDLCARYGELQHAIAEGVLTTDDVHAELGEVLAGQRLGRTNDEQVILFDSTGSAVQDAVAAAAIEGRAAAMGIGTVIDLTT